MPATPFLPKSFVEPYISMPFLIPPPMWPTISPPTLVFLKLTQNLHIVGVTFAVAIPLIIAAFEIQWVLNTYKLFTLWVSEELKRRREEKRTNMMQHYWPDFLEAKKKEMEQDSDQP
jgi:hypothetical protein